MSYNINDLLPVKVTKCMLKCIFPVSLNTRANIKRLDVVVIMSVYEKKHEFNVKTMLNTK